MINKNSMSMFAIFAVFVLSLSLASAIGSITNINAPTTIDETENSITFSFTYTYDGTGTGVDIDFSASTASLGTLSIPNQTGLNENDTRSVTGTISGFNNQGGSTLTVNIDGAASTGGASAMGSFSTVITEVFQLCANGDVGDLEISDFEVNNLGEGEDDDWFPLDQIEVEVEVENTHNDDSVKDVLVEFYIYDDTGVDVTNDFDVDDEEVDLGSIRDDDEELATFDIPEVPADLDEGDYRIYVKAYNEKDEDLHCVSTSTRLSNDFYESIDYTREDDEAVVVRSQDIETKIVAQCGQNDVILSFPVYNIGSEKEESVLVNVYNEELGIDEYELVENLRSGKRSEVDFLLKIPDTAKEDLYKLNIYTFFEYDEDEDKFDEASYDQNSFEDLDNDYRLTLEVLRCATTQGPSITARLDSEAMLGEEVVVTSMITNTNDLENFLVSASGLGSWAELVSITPQTFSLGQLQSQEVVVRFIPTQGGFHSFNIDTLVNGETFSQPVSVNIAEEENDDQESFAGLEGNTLTYIVIALVILIVLILIIIIARVSRA